MFRKTAMEIRGPDKWGDGRFGAPRGGRAHRGVDLVCEAGDLIFSPVAGTITKVGYPYNPDSPKGHKRYVELTDPDGKRHRFFYCLPFDNDIGRSIVKGEPFAVAQGLQDIYPGITDHIHYEIKLPSGGYEDPTPLVEEDHHDGNS